MKVNLNALISVYTSISYIVGKTLLQGIPYQLLVFLIIIKQRYTERVHVRNFTFGDVFSLSID